MTSKLLCCLVVAVGLASCACASGRVPGRALLHDDATPSSNTVYSGDARLFVVTSGQELVVLDLPSGRTSAKITLPLPSTLLRITNDHRYFLSFRSRGFSPEYVTVVRTGVVHGDADDGDSGYEDPYALPEGNVTLSGLPMIVRTLDVGSSIVPSHDSYLLYSEYYNCYMMAEESDGEFIVFNASALEPAEAFQPTYFDALIPDHYATLVWGPHLYLGYSSQNEVRLITMEGMVLEKFKCTGVHGSIDWKNGSTIVGAFGCNDGIRVVFGNNHSDLLPTETRVGSFMHGFGSVVYGLGRDLTSVYRVDLSEEEPSVTKVVVGGERKAFVTADDYSWFSLIHANGNLTVHDGATGSLLGFTRVADSLDASVSPSMVSYQDKHIYLTDTLQGAVLVIDVDYHAAHGPDGTASAEPVLMDQIFIGGRPQTMLLAD